MHDAPSSHQPNDNQEYSCPPSSSFPQHLPRAGLSGHCGSFANRKVRSATQAATEASEDLQPPPDGDATDDPPPYSICAATSRGESGQLVLEEGQLFFAIDWAAGASAQYDPDCIAQPQMHESVRQAKRRREEGPKPYKLDECIDVRSPDFLLRKFPPVTPIGQPPSTLGMRDAVRLLKTLPP